MLFKYACAALALTFCGAALAGPSTSCQLENKKTVTLTQLDSAPLYQYGSAPSVELRLETQAGKAKVYKGSVMFSGGGASYVRFANGPYSYVAYNGIGRGWEFTGLAVYKSERLIMRQRCTPAGQAALSIDHAEIAAPEDPQLDIFGDPPL